MTTICENFFAVTFLMSKILTLFAHHRQLVDFLVSTAFVFRIILALFLSSFFVTFWRKNLWIIWYSITYKNCTLKEAFIIFWNGRVESSLKMRRLKIQYRFWTLKVSHRLTFVCPNIFLFLFCTWTCNRLFESLKMFQKRTSILRNMLCNQRSRSVFEQKKFFCTWPLSSHVTNTVIHWRLVFLIALNGARKKSKRRDWV